MPFIIKINVRHSTTGPLIRTLRRYNNFVYNKKFNSLASTFNFDFYFDPRNQEHAEIICISHLHEVQLYFTKNENQEYDPNENELEFIGFMLINKFVNNGTPQWVKCSGYSKAGPLLDCDIAPNHFPLEIEGLKLKNVIEKLIKPFNIKLDIEKGANTGNVLHDKTAEQRAHGENIGKTSAESSQNVASYISELARSLNIVLSHNNKGDIHIVTPNTKGEPIFNFDFTDSSENNDVKKIPGIESELEFNGQPMHTHIYVIQQADDNEGSNAVYSKPLRNPLIPIGASAVYRPKVIVISSGGEFTIDQAARYELGKEIREGVKLTISISKNDINGKLIQPNNTIKVKDPTQFLYNDSIWFIQEVEHTDNKDGSRCIMHCVLPFGYDYDEKRLKNVFVNTHENLPIF